MSGTFFKCPVCGAESNHPTDLLEGYCGRCHEFTGLTLEELAADTPALIGRVQTGLMVVRGETFVVVGLYDTNDTTKVVARYRVAPEHAGYWAIALARAATAGMEDAQFTGLTLEELAADTPALVGRVQTGLMVVRGETFVVVGLSHG